MKGGTPGVGGGGWSDRDGGGADIILVREMGVIFWRVNIFF